MGITFEQVSYSYQEGTPFEGQALFDIDLQIVDKSFTAIIGHTGSGKSTLLQLLKGLMLPTKGRILVDGQVLDASSKVKDAKVLRQKVGLVFQFPESQLFAETVLKDVAFGPINYGMDPDQAEKLARQSLLQLGIAEDLFEKSPFELSGGQMRRVALAGILAMQPEILILDEPTAGLDPASRREFMSLFKDLHASGMTLVLVTHLMDDVADYADWVYVLQNGKLAASGRPEELFQDLDAMQQLQLGVPKVTALAANLRERGLKMDRLPIRMEELVEVLNG